MTLEDIIKKEDRLIRYGQIKKNQDRIYGFITFCYGRLSKGQIEWQRDQDDFDFYYWETEDEIELTMEFGSMGEYQFQAIKFPGEIIRMSNEEFEDYLIQLEKDIKKDNEDLVLERQEKQKQTEIASMMRLAEKHGYKCEKI